MRYSQRPLEVAADVLKRELQAIALLGQRPHLVKSDAQFALTVRHPVAVSNEAQDSLNPLGATVTPGPHAVAGFSRRDRSEGLQAAVKSLGLGVDLAELVPVVARLAACVVEVLLELRLGRLRHARPPS